MISPVEIRELLFYDQATGNFWWRVETRQRRNNQPCGSLHHRGAIQIRVEGKIYLAHRLAWAWMLGAWPTSEIDHVNNQPADNRWVNLRLATRTENARNSRGFSKTGLGLKGASPHSSGKWQAQIKINKVQVSLGRFDTELEAHEAYKRRARLEFGEFFNPGRIKCL